MSAVSPEESHQHHHRKKRVGKACDSCRIKKTKCDGKHPCSRCLTDNKLCTYTEKKKKEKTHPNGYVELLETRVEVLLQSFQKIVVMAEPHLPVLQTAIQKARQNQAQMTPSSPDSSASESDLTIPINEVVTCLISELDQLDDPSYGQDDISPGTRGSPMLKPESAGSLGSAEAVLHAGAFENFPPFRSEPFRSESDQSLNSPEVETFSASMADNVNSRSFVPDGYFRASVSGASREPLSLDKMESFPPRANSLFINSYRTERASSLSSLSNHFENQALEEPRPAQRISHSVKRSMSPSAMKKRSSGYVRKPASGSSSRVSSSNFISSASSSFHILPSSGHVSPSTNSTFSGHPSSTFSRPLTTANEQVDPFEDALLNDLPSNVAPDAASFMEYDDTLVPSQFML